MKQLRWIWILGAAAVLLTVLFIVVDRRSKQNEEKTQIGAPKQLFQIDPDVVTDIELNNEEGRIVFSWLDGTWKITDLTDLDEVFEFCNDSTLALISAKTPFKVEEYFGLSEAEVRAILEKSGIAYSIEYEVRSDVTPGIVINQNFPEGTELLETDSVLFIVTISVESEEFTLGDYSMMDHASVYDILTGFGFTVVECSEQSDSIVPGCVIRTEPAAGSVIERGSTITVYYAE